MNEKENIDGKFLINKAGALHLRRRRLRLRQAFTVIRYLYGIINNLIFNPMKKQLVLFVLLFCRFACGTKKIIIL